MTTPVSSLPNADVFNSGDFQKYVSNLITTTAKEFSSEVTPMLHELVDCMIDVRRRLRSAESCLEEVLAHSKETESKLHQVERENLILIDQVKKLHYEKEVKEARDCSHQLCAFPTKNHELADSSKGSSDALLKCLSKEAPEIKCSVAPFRNGGFKITLLPTMHKELHETLSKVLAAAPEVLTECGLLLRRDLPKELRMARQKVHSFLREAQRVPEFRSTTFKVTAGKVTADGVNLGAEYLWPDAIANHRQTLIAALHGVVRVKKKIGSEKGLLFEHLLRMNRPKTD